MRSIQSFTNIKALATGYSKYAQKDVDYVFEICADSLYSDEVGIEYFLLEPGNAAALENAVEESSRGWHIPSESITLEKAELFTDLSPWFAIVLFGKQTNT